MPLRKICDKVRMLARTIFQPVFPVCSPLDKDGTGCSLSYITL
jgi:hypothetical protein